VRKAFLGGMDDADAPEREQFHHALSHLVTLEIIPHDQLKRLATLAAEASRKSPPESLPSPVRLRTNQMWLLVTLSELELVDLKAVEQAAGILEARLGFAVHVARKAPPHDARAAEDAARLVQATRILIGHLHQRGVTAGQLASWADMLLHSVPLATNDDSPGERQGQAQDGRQGQREGDRKQEEERKRREQAKAAQEDAQEPAEKALYPSERLATKLRP
jgi:hypothetical protein